MRVPVRVILHNENESVIMHDETEEDEVWLYWIDQNKEPHGKSIRNLSLNAKSNHKEDIDSMTYYRSVFLFSSAVLHCLLLFHVLFVNLGSLHFFPVQKLLPRSSYFP